MLKAVILAGGRGERLKPMTDTTPKPMIEIKGKPFLRYQIELLQSPVMKSRSFRGKRKFKSYIILLILMNLIFRKFLLERMPGLINLWICLNVNPLV